MIEYKLLNESEVCKLGKDFEDYTPRSKWEDNLCLVKFIDDVPIEVIFSDGHMEPEDACLCRDLRGLVDELTKLAKLYNEQTTRLLGYEGIEA